MKNRGYGGSPTSVGADNIIITFFTSPMSKLNAWVTFPGFGEPFSDVVTQYDLDLTIY